MIQKQRTLLWRLFEEGKIATNGGEPGTEQKQNKTKQNSNNKNTNKKQQEQDKRNLDCWSGH